MKNTFLKTIGGTALAILMLTFSAQIWVSAQSDEQTQENLSERRGNDRTLEGSWDVRVTIRDCQTGAALASFPAMNTFMQGGTMQETANDAAPLLRLPGHGVWNFQSGRRYSSAFHFFRYNDDRSYAGTAKIRKQIEVNRFGDRYSATARFEFFDPNGNSFVSGCATEAGTRFE